MNTFPPISRRMTPWSCPIVLLWLAQAAQAEVVYTGLTEAQEQNARALMPLASTACDTGPWRVERLYRDAEGNLRRALQALGYYNIVVDATLEWGEDCWRATFAVTTGEPVRLRNVDVRIDGDAGDDPGFLDAIAVPRPAPGDVLDHGVYESYKAALFNAADARGYFDADFRDNRVTVVPDERAADLVLHFDSGPRYRFSDVRFTDGILRERLLQNYSDIRPGDAYSSNALVELSESLDGSGYFESVSINTDPRDEEAHTVPVDVRLTAAKRRVYTIGLGFATDSGPQGRLGYINRRRNDRGHQFESRLFGSAVKSELTASYRWPLRDPRKEWFSVNAGAQREDTDTSENDTFKLGIQRTRSLSTRWIETHYADFAYERFTIGDQDTDSRLVIVGVSRESTVGRNFRRTVRGRRLHLDLRGATDALGSDTNFLQFTASGTWLRPLGEKNRAILRTKLGTTVLDKLTELPASVRFFAGGDRSVRGYDFESLGPRDDAGLVIGGSRLVELSIEFDRLFRENWAVAAFVDTGSAFRGSEPEFSTGAGIGLRWYSPVGPVRFDVAHPFDDPDQDFRIHISLGPDL